MTTKKVSELKQAGSIDNEDEFLVIDKSRKDGPDAGDGGRTSRVTLNQVRGSLFPQGIPEGEKGDKGQRGSDGASITGEKGDKGDNVKGEPGVGIKGNVGEKGPRGASIVGDSPSHQWSGTSIRFQNPDGSMGSYTDLKGSRGAASTIAGPQGAIGPQGHQGSRGFQGFQGRQGARGIQGFQGAKGNNSTVAGPQGFQGIRGVQGHQGFQGRQGLGGLGPRGPQGFQGIRGVQGHQGIRGVQGHQGRQGARGLPSTERGFQGYQGPAGPLGGLDPVFNGAVEVYGSNGGVNHTRLHSGGLSVRSDSSRIHGLSFANSSGTSRAMCIELNKIGTDGQYLGFSGNSMGSEWMYGAEAFRIYKNNLTEFQEESEVSFKGDVTFSARLETTLGINTNSIRPIATNNDLTLSSSLGQKVKIQSTYVGMPWPPVDIAEFSNQEIVFHKPVRMNSTTPGLKAIAYVVRSGNVVKHSKGFSEAKWETHRTWSFTFTTPASSADAYVVQATMDGNYASEDGFTVSSRTAEGFRISAAWDNGSVEIPGINVTVFE